MRNILIAIAWAATVAFTPLAALAASPYRMDVAGDQVVQKSGGGETRALLIARDGKIVYEHYGPGYTAETRFVAWSMAKTVTALALGVLYDAGKIELDAPAPIAAWRIATDGREKITVRHLLTMTSGLQHQEGQEDGKPIAQSDTVRLLFTDGAQSAAVYAITRPLVHPPGTRWQYSTATTHILAEIITQAITASKNPEERRKAVADWFRARIWAPLDIRSAEWDFDAAGLFLGGSMLHMTAGDYLKLGKMMQNRGAAIGSRRVVSQAWIDVLLAKAQAANNNHYAGQLWLNTGPAPGQPPVLFHPLGGDDTYAMIGHLGQYVIVAPTKGTVIVRLGKSTTVERMVVRESIGTLLQSLP